MERDSAANPLCKVINFIEDFALNIVSSSNRHEYIRGKRAFKNSTKLPVNKVVMMLLRPMLLTLQTELFRSTSVDIDGSDCASAPAFIKSRKHLRLSLFKELLTQTYSFVNQHSISSPPTFKGLPLIGGDGTTVYLPQTKDNHRVFGYCRNQHGTQSFSRSFILVNLLSGLCLAGQMGRAKTSEKHLLSKLIHHLPQKCIFVADRLHASIPLFYDLTQREKFYVIRCKASFNNQLKKFIEQDIDDLIVDAPIHEKGKTDIRKLGYKLGPKDCITYRIIRVKLKDGSYEYLITNILDQDYTVEDFSKIYQLRWGIETKINTIKNRLMLECFTGHTPFFIRQDFYARLTFANIAVMLESLAQENLPKIKKGKDYKISTAETIRSLMDIFVAAIRKEKDLSGKVEKTITFLLRFPVTSKKNRSFKRVRKTRKARGKRPYSENYKGTG